MNQYDESLEKVSNTVKKIDSIIKNLNNKSNEIRLKIEMLIKKVNLKLQDATQLLQFQHSVLINEINYLKNLKQILLSNINSHLYYLSENISMLAVSVLNIYKDIPVNKTKTILMTSKKDEFSKIVSDITFNLNYINEILDNFKKYNEQLSEEMNSGNFHCKTLKNDMSNVYDHINLEYTKYVNDMQKRMEYYVEFSNNVNEQLDNMKISNFYT